ncbi:MAG: site-specific integrase [Defluviitaleaceae bacterium]|nr:site-specific integrase [Defluviitaleaceae bacterium]
MPKRTHGEGTIWQDKKGLWRGEITLGYDASGKRNKKSFSSMDREKLLEKMENEKYKLRRNIATVSSDYTVAEWVDFWLENYKAIELKSSTYDKYEMSFNKHARDKIGHIKLTKLRPEMIQSIYNDMYKANFSTSTIKGVHIVLSQSFKQAIKNEILYRNPCDALVVPKVKPKVNRAMTVEEQEIFLRNIPESTFGNMFVFALNTGMRIGEISALVWSDIDFNSGFISVDKTSTRVRNRDEGATTKTKIIISEPKTSKGTRQVPINNAVRNILLEQKKKGGIFVFSSRSNAITASREVLKAFKRALDKAELSNEINVHSLRHTFATRLLEKGANIKVVSEILGHASVQITLDIYSHAMPNMKQETVDLLN